MTENTSEQVAAHAVAEHFDDADQQHEAAELGMWTFLVTEIMLFGALFTGYTVYRAAFPEAFAQASGHLYMWIGAVNTAVLLASSLLMALAVHAAAATGARRLLVMNLMGVVALGMLFLVLKAVEYALDVHDQLVPLAHFDAAKFDEPDRAAMFFVFYWTMTGVHGLHVASGLGVIAALIVPSWRGRFSAEYHNPIEMSGLYWHFVDVIWVFLFPLLYLIG